MPLKFFITGTDTEVGKTYISVGLLKAFAQLGYQTIGIKPVASGGFRQHDRIVNDDALLLQSASTIKLDYALINPFTFEEPIAPHLAALKENVPLNLKNVINAIHPALSHPADVHLIEGAGGWHVPLNRYESISAISTHYHLGVIMVVRIRLGCINHALLTADAITQKQGQFCGWVANCIDEEVLEKENVIATLKTLLPAPCLGVIEKDDLPEMRLTIQKLLVRD